MRRGSRLTKKKEKSISDKIIMYSTIGIVVLTAILIVLFLYSKNLSEDVKNSTLTLEQMAEIKENNTEKDNTQSASTDIGKNVEEAKSELDNKGEENKKNNTLSNTNKETNTPNLETKNNVTITNKSSNTKKENNKNMTANNINSNVNPNTTKKEEVKKELSFEKPVEGEIVKEYARDNLVYSETLKEWVTHLGIDIKADKTTVVKAAEAGTIKSIKNDPRYGITVVIEHVNGYVTIYSNLLTAEFVKEGEKVKQGQSIGTVGNTAVFEIADEPHLHFEILKNSIQEDPNIYIK